MLARDCAKAIEMNGQDHYTSLVSNCLANQSAANVKPLGTQPANNINTVIVGRKVSSFSNNVTFWRITRGTAPAVKPGLYFYYVPGAPARHIYTRTVTPVAPWEAPLLKPGNPTLPNLRPPRYDEMPHREVDPFRDPLEQDWRWYGPKPLTLPNTPTPGKDRPIEVGVEVIVPVGPKPGVGTPITTTPGTTTQPETQTETAPKPPGTGLPTLPVTGTHTSEKPGPRRKEKKIISRGVAAAFKVAGLITEGVDLVTAIHDALPPELRSDLRWSSRKGKWVKIFQPTPQEKARDIWENTDDIDIKKAVDNIIKQQIEDAFYGMPGKWIKERHQEWYDQARSVVGREAGSSRWYQGPTPPKGWWENWSPVDTFYGKD